MRKITALLLAGLVVGLLAAPSFAGNDGRTVTRDYTITRARIHVQDVRSWIGTQREFFRALPGERWVSFSLEDNNGVPVRGRVEVGGVVVEFCSDTQKPIRVRAGQEIAASAIFGPCGSAFSLVTEGAITATFSK